jgi:hypothetical protein
VAALKAHYTGDTIRQQIDDLALAFVTPLGTDDDYVSTHKNADSPNIELWIDG